MNPATRQRGAALAIALVFLLLMTLFGVTAMQSSIMEERMAGNFKDQNNAFQAAESGLNDGENDLTANISSTGSVFDNVCTSGLCTEAATGTPPVWEAVNWNASANTRDYGEYTGGVAGDVVAGNNLSGTPRYLVETVHGRDTPPPGFSLEDWPKYRPDYYRITARATGANSTSLGMVQTTHTKRR